TVPQPTPGVLFLVHGPSGAARGAEGCMDSFGIPQANSCSPVRRCGMAANGKRLAVLALLVFMALGGNDVIRSAEGPPRGPDAAQAVLTLKPGQVEISSVRFSPDGKRLAGACSDGTARVWDASTGKELLRIKAHEVSVRSVAYSPTGKQLATVAEAVKV